MGITEALRAAARSVKEHGAASALGGPGPSSDVEGARVADEVSALGYEFDSLAAASETAPVYAREYETIRDELSRRGLTLPPEVDQAVTSAFLDEAAKHAAPRRRPASDSKGGSRS